MVNPIAGMPELDGDAPGQVRATSRAEVGDVVEVVDAIRVPPVLAAEPDPLDGRDRLNVIRILGVDSRRQR